MIFITVIIAIPFYVIIIAMIYGVRTVYTDIKRALPPLASPNIARQISAAAGQFASNRALRREFMSTIAKNIGADERLVESQAIDRVLRKLASEAALPRCVSSSSRAAPSERRARRPGSAPECDLTDSYRGLFESH